MTDFFTHCWRNERLRQTLALLGMTLALLCPVPTKAQTAAEVSQLRLERSAEGILLFANIKIELPPAVEDALQKGVPMFFVAQADVVRHRWYWSDRQVATAQRHMRLAYQPLTRRWRLNVASGVITPNSLGLSLSQHFDSLPDAIAALQRVSGWKIVDASVIEADAILKVEFRFDLDLSQLPRPFQIGAFGQSDWTISASASRQIGPESNK